MNLISENSWQTVTQTNQTLIQKWEALQRARKRGNAKETLSAEMQYLSALQNLNAVVEIALSAANLRNRVASANDSETKTVY